VYNTLDLYEEPYDQKKTPINLDEKTKQFLGEKRTLILVKPRKKKYGYENVRNARQTY